jgi:hypothetical protein
VCVERLLYVVDEAVGLECLSVLNPLTRLDFPRPLLGWVAVCVSDEDRSPLFHGLGEVVHDTRENRWQWSTRFCGGRRCHLLVVVSCLVPKRLFLGVSGHAAVVHQFNAASLAQVVCACLVKTDLPTLASLAGRDIEVRRQCCWWYGGGW